MYGEALFVKVENKCGERYILCIPPKRYYLLFLYSASVQSKVFFFPTFDLNIRFVGSSPRWVSYIREGSDVIRPLGLRAFRRFRFTVNDVTTSSWFIPAGGYHIDFAYAYDDANNLVIGIKDVIYKKFQRDLK